MIKWIVPLIASCVILIGLGLMGLGLLIGMAGHPLLGISCAFVGLIAITIGLVSFPAGMEYFDPGKFEGGVATWWGRIIIINGKTITLKGYVFMADYFPFYFGAIRVNMQRKKWTIKRQVLSVEKEMDGKGKVIQIPLDGGIEMTVRPDPDNMHLYLQSGGDLEKIELLVSPMVYRETQREITYHANDDGSVGMNMMQISQEGNILDKALADHINGKPGTPGLFEQKGFGVKCDNVNVDFPLPTNVITALRGIGSIRYDNVSRASEYRADAESAKALKTALEQGDTSGVPVTPLQALNKMIELRLLRDSKIQRIQNEQVGDGDPTKGKGRAPVIFEEVPVGGK